MLIQNDEILVIFQYLQAKYCRVLLQTAQATHKYLDVLKSKKKIPYFFAFAVLRCCKKVFAQADRAFGIGLQNNFKNMVG